MSRFMRLCQTSVGAKQVMAVTGVLLFGFVIGHLLGNLLVFAGREAVNNYAHKLRELGALLWAVRVALLAVFLAHVGSALRLWRLNRAARPEPYEVTTHLATTYAGRTIVMSGLLILAYVVYHLMHLAMILLGFHLSHGLTSFFQTVGLNHPAYNACFKRVGPVAGVVITIGYISIPLAVLAGLLRLP
ncbi:MAG: succinate dehydrogenase cytochrome b subunit [Candidatus Tectomicrobia bacterium]|nr:succinate dehydrogenase cytochrome b subunit [Candidatus Tectomicrobia bacterium]